MRLTNGIPLGCSLLLPVGTVNSVQTRKALPTQFCRSRDTRYVNDVLGFFLDLDLMLDGAILNPMPAAAIKPDM
jgi:hypothetical protein